MTVREGDGRIVLLGECGLEEAEALRDLMAAQPSHPVDVSGAGHLHAAIVQLLLARRPLFVGAPRDAFAALWLHHFRAADESLL